MACPAMSTWAVSLWIRLISLITRGVRVKDTNEAMRSPYFQFAGLKSRADLANPTDKHSARTRHRIVMLTPGRHDLQHDFSHAPLVITGLLTGFD